MRKMLFNCEQIALVSSFFSYNGPSAPPCAGALWKTIIFSMIVRVRLFSLLREAVGSSELLLHFSKLTVGELWEEMEEQFPHLAQFRSSRAVAVNRQHTSESHQLKDGDEVAFFPPVSGG